MRDAVPLGLGRKQTCRMRLIIRLFFYCGCGTPVCVAGFVAWSLTLLSATLLPCGYANMDTAQVLYPTGHLRQLDDLALRLALVPFVREESLPGAMHVERKQVGI